MERDRDYIFPELKESEEERVIRILHSISSKMSFHLRDIFTEEEFQCFDAWLEKQETSYTAKDVDDAYLKGISDTKNEIERQYEANYQIRKDIATFIFNYRGDIKDRAKWMNYLGIKVSFTEEKQGGMSNKNDERLRKTTISFLKDFAKQGYENAIECIDWLENLAPKPKGKTALEAIKEEKVDNANKIKPKFKIEKGKWYVCIRDMLCDYGYGMAFQKGDIYLAPHDGKLIPCNSNVPDEIVCCADTYFREWTIEDAKDGDVLVSRSPFIYGKQCPYGGLDWYNNNFIKASNFIFPDNPVHPATKEQRDTLKKAMTKAGYEWNDEKKQLIKIIDYEEDNV